jgi:hypothetical protein
MIAERSEKSTLSAQHLMRAACVAVAVRAPVSFIEFHINRRQLLELEIGAQLQRDDRSFR